MRRRRRRTIGGCHGVYSGLEKRRDIRLFVYGHNKPLENENGCSQLHSAPKIGDICKVLVIGESVDEKMVNEDADPESDFDGTTALGDD